MKTICILDPFNSHMVCLDIFKHIPTYDMMYMEMYGLYLCMFVYDVLTERVGSLVM